MSRYRWVILGVTCLTMVPASLSADVIRPSEEAGAPQVAAPALARSGSEVPGDSRLALSPGEGPWAELIRRPLLSLDLADPAIGDRATVARPGTAAAGPDLPAGALLGPSSERIATPWAQRSFGAGSDGESGPTLRIPEPASVALVAAGLIGLVARSRLRRNLHPKVLKKPA